MCSSSLWNELRIHMAQHVRRARRLIVRLSQALVYSRRLLRMQVSVDYVLEASLLLQVLQPVRPVRLERPRQHGIQTRCILVLITTQLMIAMLIATKASMQRALRASAVKVANTPQELPLCAPRVLTASTPRRAQPHAARVQPASTFIKITGT